MLRCEEIQTAHTPQSLALLLHDRPGLVVLRSRQFELPEARSSFVTADPFLTFRSFGSHCEIVSASSRQQVSGDPWLLLEELLARYQQPHTPDLPFPAGGCFGFWGYNLRYFTEPNLPRTPPGGTSSRESPSSLPDSHLGFYSSLVVFDHRLDKCWIISTGLAPDGSRDHSRAELESARWRQLLETPPPGPRTLLSAATPDPDPRPSAPVPGPQPQASLAAPPGPRTLLSAAAPDPNPRPSAPEPGLQPPSSLAPPPGPRTLLSAATPDPDPPPNSLPPPLAPLDSNLSGADFISRVERAQEYIRLGHIYQVNLSHRLSAPCPGSPWDLFERLADASPAPFSAFLDAGDFQLVSSSPELFLRLSGRSIRTRPIKGTRPRSSDPTIDLQLAYELQTSPKEMAELVMITDLLRNDLGRVCEFGSIQVPDHARLERFSHVQHLVSTVEGRLRPGLSHLRALASCFPGGSITGAPKFRAMEIIDELETVGRGPYTGALGYLGFNGESQLSIIIRTAVCSRGLVHFHVGAGIVADSNPAAEYDETIAKAQGFLQAFAPLPSLTHPTLGGTSSRESPISHHP